MSYRVAGFNAMYTSSLRPLLPLLFLAAAASALNLPPGYVDAMPVLRAVNEAIGVDKLHCVSFSGEGYAGKAGQNALAG